MQKTMLTTAKFLASTVIAIFVVAALSLQFWPSQPLDKDLKADLIVIDKSQRKLTLLKGATVLKTYRVSLGRQPRGPKVKQGDARTPEGEYKIDWRNTRSGFHRSLHISYPNMADRAQARKLGVSSGGDIMIHGIKNGFGWLGRAHLLWDWTNGCIAVTDQEIREIWSAAPNGTAVEIRA
ncbi:MAG: L,D-transpeptidase family protein [Alphaproteobacteria bacterium]